MKEMNAPGIFPPSMGLICRRSTLVLLFTLGLSSLRVSMAGRLQKAKGRRLQAKELQSEFFEDREYREPERGFPGPRFYEDGEGLDEFEDYDWTRGYAGDSTGYTERNHNGAWAWRQRIATDSPTSGSCKSKSKNKLGKGRGKGKGSSKSATYVPSESPSDMPSNEPSLSSSPSSEPSQMPSGMPSLSQQPSSSAVPSSMPSTSLEPTAKGKGKSKVKETFKSTKVPTMKSTKMSSIKSTKAPTMKSTKKSARCSPTVSPAPSISDYPTVSPRPSSSNSPSSVPSLSLAPSVSNAPSTSPAPSQPPSLSQAPSLSQVPSMVPTESISPTASSAPSEMPSSSTFPSESPSVSQAPSSSTSPSAMPTNPSDASPGSKDGDALPSGDISLNSPDGDVCSLIAAGGPAPDRDDDRMFPIGLGVEFEGIETAAVIDILATLRVPVSLWVAGCEDEAEAFLRRLKSSGTVDYAEMDPWEKGGDCAASSATSVCEIFETIMSIFVTGDISDEVLVARIQRAFEIFQGLITGNPNIKSMDVEGMEIDTEDDTNAVVGGDNAVADDGIAAGTVVGIAAAGLAFLLLLILLIRRNQESDEPSHLKLEDEGNEATFIREFDTDPSSEGDSPYKTRNIHVIGEADSVISGWTGYTKDVNNSFDEGAGVPGKLGHAHGDVHLCSSATCEVCELRRQGGVTFQPTGSPPRSHLPTDASREYLSEDTVEL